MSENKVSYEEFKKNPLLYFLFLPLLATVFLFIALDKNYKKQIEYYKLDIKKLEKKLETKDSIIYFFYEIKGSNRVIDSLKK